MPDISHFSEKEPDLRLVWSPTTLAAYMQDPLAYYWRHVKGYKTETHSLAQTWGSAYHEAIAEYWKARLGGASRQEAVESGVRKALEHREPFRLALAEARLKDAKTRNLRTLLRAVVWYDYKYGQDGRFQPTYLHEGEPAVELDFAIPIGKAATGEDYILAGVLDQIMIDDMGRLVVVERKTTTRTIASGYYWQQYNPSVQVWCYDLAGAELLPNEPLHGVVVEACQTAMHFCDFERHEVVRTPEQRAHWRECLMYWIKRAEEDALQKRWDRAMNPATMVWETPFRRMEAKPPSMWDALLDIEFVRGDPFDGMSNV